MQKLRIALIPVFVSMVTADAAAQSEPSTLPETARFVQVAEVKLRGQPQHWAPGAATLKYGDALEVVSEQRSWVQVRTATGALGFVPVSAVTKRAVVLNVSDAPIRVEADASEVVLAGKGFSSGLEEALAARDSSMNFTAVDAMEKNLVDDAEILPFLNDGKLRTEAEG